MVSHAAFSSLLIILFSSDSNFERLVLVLFASGAIFGPFALLNVVLSIYKSISDNFWLPSSDMATCLFRWRLFYWLLALILPKLASFSDFSAVNWYLPAALPPILRSEG